MTPRERVVATINHKEPDKVPIDCGGTICSTLTRTAHNTLKKYLNINKPQEQITDPKLDTVVPCDEILDRFQVDFRRVALRPPSALNTDDPERQSFAATSAANEEKPRGFRFKDEFGTTWQKADYDYSPVEYAMKEFSLEDLKKYKWPDPYDPGRTAGLREDAKNLVDTTDFCIVGDIMCGGPFEQACWLREYSTIMVDLYENPDFARLLFEKITDLDIAWWDVYLDKIGDLVQVVCQGDDLGTQIGEWISPELYKEFIYPCHKRMFDFIHSKTKAKIFLHTCGSVKKFIPYLIEAGIDALNPVQYTAKDMGIANLKKEFGRELAFWGGSISTQTELSDAHSVKDIEATVKRNMDILMKDGGYVFAATHNIQHECPPEKLLSIYDTAVSYRNYSA
ncbi:uroporphyrinogen decarboxylase [Spirochaetia bacterium]|nr:uroporphyrinogen decarboxylase [Spirochaetia bacterium]